MNPNLTPVQRAARNLFAGQTDIADPAVVELAFENPAVTALAVDMARCMIDGPFGTFVPTPDLGQDHVVKSPNHQEGYEEGHRAGYLKALRQVLDVIDNDLPSTPELAALRGEVEIGIGSATQPELPLEGDKAVDGIDAFVDVLSNLLGRRVQVVRL